MRRVIHAGDQTGHEVMDTLVRQVERHENIAVKEHVVALDLITRDGRCIGATALDFKGNKFLDLYASVTVLCTGGVGQIYAKTSNSFTATGDGVAMAWRAGAEIVDMEFIQFHPSILDKGDSPYFLVSETVRGEGGVLVNREGEPFMPRYHALMDLAPRDVVSRAIVEEQRKGQVYIDIRHRGEVYLRERFPGIYDECMRRGISMAEDLIPVSPAAHYLCGGVKTNEYGETSIPCLLALGECACSGVHGANRLASNSTLECLAFSGLAFENLRPPFHWHGQSVEGDEKDVKLVQSTRAKHLKAELQDVMWTLVGIIRSIEGLEEVIERLGSIEGEAEALLERGLSVDRIELRNMASVAKLVAQAAYIRRESRGTHKLEPYAFKDDENWLKHIVFRRGEHRIEKHNEF